MLERVNTEAVCTGTHNYRLDHKTHSHTSAYACTYEQPRI